jgi:hypothetical protein
LNETVSERANKDVFSARALLSGGDVLSRYQDGAPFCHRQVDEFGYHHWQSYASAARAPGSGSILKAV